MAKKPKTKLWDWQMKLKLDTAACKKCDRISHLTVDHIIPANMLYALNLVDEVYEWEENFQIICAACNKLKGGNLDISNPRTYPLMRQALERSESQLSE